MFCGMLQWLLEVLSKVKVQSYVVYSILITCVLSKPNIQRDDYVQNLKWRSALVIPAEQKQTGTIIFLHGVGDSAENFAKAIDSIRAPYMKIVCPRANKIPLSFANGNIASGWFDIRKVSNHTEEDYVALARSTSHIISLINEEIKQGIRPERIIVGGVNQGAAVALHAGLAYPKKLGGIVTYSAWLPMHKPFFQYFSSFNDDYRTGIQRYQITFHEHINKPSIVTPDFGTIIFSNHITNEMPIFLGHGELDRVIHYVVGKISANLLMKITRKLLFKTYPGQDHTISEEGMNDIRIFMKHYVRPL